MDTRYILGLIVGVVLGWFALGIIYNLRRGEALLRWMQSGLPKIGERTTLRWLGSSVAELIIERARNPFRRLEVLVVLAPRDVVWMWLWARLRGRRDTLILRGQIQGAPRVAFELADPTSWFGRAAIQDVLRAGWEQTSFPPGASDGQAGCFRLLAPQGTLSHACEAVPAYLPALEGLSPAYLRLSVRRDPPSLEVHIPFPDPRTADASEFFTLLRELAQRAGASDH